MEDKPVDISAVSGNCKTKDDLVIVLDYNRKQLEEANKVGVDLHQSIHEFLGELRLQRTEIKRNNQILSNLEDKISEMVAKLDELIDVAQEIHNLRELMNKESNPLIQELIKALYQVSKL